MTFCVVDDRAWPQVWVRFDGLPREEQFDDMLRNLTRLYERKQTFSLLFDTRRLGIIPPGKYAPKMSQWIHDHRDDARTWLRCSSVIVENHAVRAFIKLLLTMRPPSAPLKVCNTLRESVEYLGWDRLM
jgi:hypothetical protein